MRRRRWVWGAMLAAAGFGIGLAAPRAQAQDDEVDYEEGDVQGGGTIAGTITWSGGPVTREALKITKDPETCAHEPILSESLVVDAESGGIQNVVVRILGISKGKAFDRSKNARIDQKGCCFHPHVILTPPESIVEVANDDPITHNVSASAFVNDPINKLQPTKSPAIEYEVFDPERIRVKCDIHPWMGATLIVMANPYYAVTDAQGAFRLEDVPPGTWTLQLWQEQLGEAEVAVTVEAGQEAVVTHAWGPQE